MKGKNGTTSFLPNKKKGGQVRFSEKVTYIPNREETCVCLKIRPNKFIRK